MKILKLSAENVKRIKVVEITPAGSLVEVTGANGSGKTSVIDSIFYALDTARVLPAQPVRRGAKDATIKLDLGDIIVTKTISEDKKTQLVVQNANGARFDSPQHMLNKLVGRISFDPLAFLSMDREEQHDAVRGLVKLGVDIDALDGQNQSDYEERTRVNRSAKELRAQAAGIDVPDGLPEQAVEVADLVVEMEKAAEDNALLERRKANREQAERDIKDKRERAERLRSQAATLESEVDRLVEKLSGAEPLPGPVDVAAIRQRISQARDTNDGIAARARRAKLETDATSAEEKSKQLTDAIAVRTKQKEDAIAAAEMPLPDLSFGDGQVLYRGLPLDQASAAEQLRISVAIAMAANPTLRVLLVRQGSLLDDDSLKLLRDMAETNDYQVWLERVDTSGKIGVVMEDGHVKGAAPAETSTAAPAASGRIKDGASLL